MNWYKKAAKKWRRYKKRSSDRPVYYGPARLVSFMGRPAIVGNTMKVNRDVLGGLGFSWNGDIQIDGTELGDAPNNVINGAMIGTRELMPEETQQLTVAGVDISTSQTLLTPWNPQAQPAQPQPIQPIQPMPGPVAEPVPGWEAGQQETLENPQPDAQIHEENVDMLLRLREATNWDDLDAFTTVNIAKLKERMTNPDLMKSQGDMREAFAKFMLTSPKYSFYNRIMILMQNPNATVVGGKGNFWRDDHGIKVKEGENPMIVSRPNFTGKPPLWQKGKGKWVPTPFRMKLVDEAKKELGISGNTPEEKKQIDNLVKKWHSRMGTITGFADAPVFDASQTEIPEGSIDPSTGKSPFNVSEFHKSYINKFNTNDEYTDTIWSAVTQAMKADGVKDVSQKDTGSSGGYADYSGNVVVNERSQGEARIQTLFHEYTHNILHIDPRDDSDKQRMKEWKEMEKANKISNRDLHKIKEGEAAAVEYTLMQTFGLTGDQESVAKYLILWDIAPEKILESEKIIRKTVNYISEKVKNMVDQLLVNQPVTV